MEHDHAHRHWQSAWLTGHTTAVVSVLFCPSSALVATTSCDGSVRVWIETTGAAVAMLMGGTRTAACNLQLQWSPDARVLSGQHGHLWTAP